MAKRKTKSEVILDLFGPHVSSLNEARYLLDLAKGIMKRRELEEGEPKPRAKKAKKKSTGGMAGCPHGLAEASQCGECAIERR